MKKYLAIIITAIITSCSTVDRDQVADLEAEVMSVHDEVMPKMDQIMNLKSQLSKKIQAIDSLQNLGVSSNTTAEERIKAMDLNEKLNQSDQLMMDWMHGYNGDSAKKLPENEAIAYFEKEKTKIFDVRQLTLKSIQEAEAFLR